MHCKLGESWLCFLPQSPGRCFPSPSCSFLHSFHLPISSLKQLCRIPWSRAGIHTKSRPVWVKKEQPQSWGEGRLHLTPEQGQSALSGALGEEEGMSPSLSCWQGVGALAPALGILLQEFASCVSTTVELFLILIVFCVLFLKYINENLLLELEIVTPGF